MAKTVLHISLLLLALILCILLFQRINISMAERSDHGQHSFLQRSLHPPADARPLVKQRFIGHKHVVCAPPPYSCW